MWRGPIGGFIILFLLAFAGLVVTTGPMRDATDRHWRQVSAVGPGPGPVVPRLRWPSR